MTNNLLTNESEGLKPNAIMNEPIFEFDFPGLKIGVAQYPEGPTGCTVIRFDPNNSKEHRGARFFADVRGGSPVPKLHKLGWADAICLTGGSILGLESTEGVMLQLLSEQGFEIDWLSIPAVPGAVVWDFHIRDNSLYPDKILGRMAAKNAVEGKFPLGRQGAGSSVRVGGGILGQSRNAMKNPNRLFELSGQGAGFNEDHGVKIFACVILNAIGAIKNRKGEIIKGHFHQQKNKRLSITEQVEIFNEIQEKNPLDKKKMENTTLTVIVVNQKLNGRELKQITRQVHSSMSKMIDPFHTMNDGDVLFFVTTDEIESGTLPISALGSFSTEVVWDAVLNCFEKV